MAAVPFAASSAALPLRLSLVVVSVDVADVAEEEDEEGGGGETVIVDPAASMPSSWCSGSRFFSSSDEDVATATEPTGRGRD